VLLVAAVGGAPQGKGSGGSACVELGEAESRRTENGNAFRFYKDVHYPGSRGDQLADLYVPEAGVAVPAILLIHGGGWAGGDKGGEGMVEFAMFAVDQGYAAVSVNYTLTKFAGGTPRGSKIRGAWPDNLYDCKSALRWMRRISSAIGIDQSRIGVCGGSAGGHLALLCGLSSSCAELNQNGGALEEDGSVRCVVDFYGIPDVRKFETYSLMQEADRGDARALALASPVEHVSKESPPVLVVHGAADSDVELSLSEEFVSAMRSRGAPHVFKVLPGAGHGFGLRSSGEDLRPLVAGFLRKHL
jgi:acetyl esterase/lipase